MAMVDVKTFTSVRFYHEKFVARFIRLSQDNPTVWATQFPMTEWKLVAKEKREKEKMEKKTISDSPRSAVNA
jgi:hypothetical protein